MFGFVGIGRRNGLVVKVKVIGFFFRQGHIFISFFIMEEGGGRFMLWRAILLSLPIMAPHSFVPLAPAPARLVVEEQHLLPSSSSC